MLTETREASYTIEATTREHQLTNVQVERSMIHVHGRRQKHNTRKIKPGENKNGMWNVCPVDSSL